MPHMTLKRKEQCWTLWRKEEELLSLLWAVKNQRNCSSEKNQICPCDLSLVSSRSCSTCCSLSMACQCFYATQKLRKTLFDKCLSVKDICISHGSLITESESALTLQMASKQTNTTHTFVSIEFYWSVANILTALFIRKVLQCSERTGHRERKKTNVYTEILTKVH